jgi:hypothetical protein
LRSNDRINSILRLIFYLRLCSYSPLSGQMAGSAKELLIPQGSPSRVIIPADAFRLRHSRWLSASEVGPRESPTRLADPRRRRRTCHSVQLPRADCRNGLVDVIARL